ncbi:MAG: [FeFe] hydrogenase H-cluster maturation GTPase HydF [Eggerthellaceae bacterium]|nr:[FeFe] hydrogenase H-cluster maturation GTPase HydF [Eggerthellaceae bacterium]
MSLNATPSAERLHIGFFGIRNAGKSSVVNAITNQDLSIVSDTKGTTTDPVKKTMELLPLGPVVIIDTPGIDDEGDLGAQRVAKAKKALHQCDCAVLVVDATCGLQAADLDLIEAFKLREIPYVIAYNKIDALLNKGNSPVPLPAQASEGLTKEACDYLSKTIPGHASPTLAANEALISAQSGQGIYELKDLIGSCAKQAESNKRLVADLLEENDLIVLVIPIDSSAPKGRIILPQQMVMRDALDRHAICIACQPENLTETLQACARKPRLVVTDSQAFEQVNRLVPDDLALTSFSILMARYKGNLEDYAAGAARLAQLNNNSKVLIAEGCTHHRRCDDIGTVKIPNWIRSFTNASPHFDFTSGGGFPESLEGYDLVIHCGACMLNDREMRYRIASCRAAGVPIVNYGIAIAEMHGILRRSLAPFPQASAAFKESF